MSRSKPLRKPRRTARKQIRLRMQPWLLTPIFSPAESVLDAIEFDGTLLSAGGTPVCHVPYHQTTYPAIPALQCVAEIFDVARVGDPGCPSSVPLHQLAAKLERVKLLEPADLVACRGCLAQLRTFAGRMTLAQMQDLMRTMAIKIEFDEAGLKECDPHSEELQASDG